MIVHIKRIFQMIESNMILPIRQMKYFDACKGSVASIKLNEINYN